MWGGGGEGVIPGVPINPTNPCFILRVLQISVRQLGHILSIVAETLSASTINTHKHHITQPNNKKIRNSKAPYTSSLIRIKSKRVASDSFQFRNNVNLNVPFRFPVLLQL